MRRLTIALVALLCIACSSTPQYRTVDGAMLGTTYHIVAETSLSSQQIFAAMERINREAIGSMSIFDSTSLLSRINHGSARLLSLQSARSTSTLTHVSL